MESEIKLSDLFQTPRQHSSLALPIRNKELPRWLSIKESACDAGAAGDKGSVPGLGRSPGGENGNPLQYPCLEKSHEQRSLVGCRVHKFAKESDRTE